MFHKLTFLGSTCQNLDGVLTIELIIIAAAATELTILILGTAFLTATIIIAVAISSTVQSIYLYRFEAAGFFLFLIKAKNVVQIFSLLILLIWH